MAGLVRDKAGHDSIMMALISEICAPGLSVRKKEFADSKEEIRRNKLIFFDHVDMTKQALIMTKQDGTVFDHVDERGKECPERNCKSQKLVCSRLHLILMPKTPVCNRPPWSEPARTETLS